MLAVVFAVVLHATPLGRAIFAIGAGQEAAFFAGIRVKRIKFWLYVLSGMLCGFAGVLWTLRFASARYDAGVGMELYVVTIVLLGGISIFGGRGTIRGVVLAVAVLGTLQTALTADLMPAQDQNIVVGGSPPRERHRPERGRDLPAGPHAAAQLRRLAGTAPQRRRRRDRESRHLRDRPRRVLAAVRGPARAAGGLSARDRGASRGAGRGGRSPPASSTPPQAARQAGETLAAARPDLVLLYTATYATSSQVLPTVQAVDAPVVILNLQPTRTLDYEAMTTGEWLANCSACCVPEIAGAFTRARIPYRTVTGTLLDGDPAWDVLREWLDAAHAVRSLRTARIGFLGHTYPGMLDLYSDFTQVHAQTGAHVEVLEIDDLVERVESADADAIERKGEEIRQTFDLADAGIDPIAAEITPEIFEWSARVAVGLDRLVEDFELDGLTYYYRGVGGNIAERVAAGLIVGNSLLTARGVPASGEGDLKTNVAMLLLDRLGCGGSYTEFYALDFDDEFVLMGHDGPGHLAIAEGRPVARALKLYHGKSGAGLSIEMKVRLGPVTILGVTQTADGRLKLIAAEGESISGPTFRIGNTNSRIRFRSGPTAFFDTWCAEGPTHHVALGVGHQLSRVAQGRRSPRARARRCGVASTRSSVPTRLRVASRS